LRRAFHGGRWADPFFVCLRNFFTPGPGRVSVKPQKTEPGRGRWGRVFYFFRQKTGGSFLISRAVSLCLRSQFFGGLFPRSPKKPTREFPGPMAPGPNYYNSATQGKFHSPFWGLFSMASGVGCWTDGLLSQGRENHWGGGHQKPTAKHGRHQRPKKKTTGDCRKGGGGRSVFVLGFDLRGGARGPVFIFPNLFRKNPFGFFPGEAPQPRLCEDFWDEKKSLGRNGKQGDRLRDRSLSTNTQVVPRAAL